MTATATTQGSKGEPTHSAFQTAVQSPLVCIGGPEVAAAVAVDVDAAPDAAVELVAGAGEFAFAEEGLADPATCVALPFPLSDIVRCIESVDAC